MAAWKGRSLSPLGLHRVDPDDDQREVGQRQQRSQEFDDRVEHATIDAAESG